MILEGGRIYTGDPALPHVHALPIDDRGRVSRGVEAWEGDVSAVSNERIDLTGRTVLPGLRDAGAAFTEHALRDASGDRSALETLAVAQRAAHAVGLVAIHDTSAGPDALRLWQTLDRDERTTLRVTVAVDVPRARAAALVGLRSGFGPERVRIGSAVLDPCDEQASDIAGELRAAGLDVTLVADDATTMQRAARAAGADGATRTRIRIRSIAPPAELSDVAVVAVDASASTVLADVIARRLPLAVASGPLEPTPLTWIGALRRAGADAVTALRALTTTPATLDGAHSRAGTLAPGAPADLVILDGDPLEVPPDRVDEIEIVATMVAGRWVHGRPPW